MMLQTYIWGRLAVNLWSVCFVSFDSTEEFAFELDEIEMAIFEALGIMINKSNARIGHIRYCTTNSHRFGWIQVQGMQHSFKWDYKACAYSPRRQT